MSDTRQLRSDPRVVALSEKLHTSVKDVCEAVTDISARRGCSIEEAIGLVERMGKRDFHPIWEHPDLIERGVSHTFQITAAFDAQSLLDMSPPAGKFSLWAGDEGVLSLPSPQGGKPLATFVKQFGSDIEFEFIEDE